MLLKRDNPRTVPDVSQSEPNPEGWTLATRLTDVRAFPRSGAGADLDDDKTLVLAFQSGDIDAYSDIFVKYRALSAQICYRILQDREEADEAVQETMLRVYRGLPRFNGRYQLQAWVARIATNVALDMVRARSRRPQRDPAKPDISEDAGLILALTDDTSETVERVLDQEEIRSTLESIPDRHRQALVLREFEGRSHEEIGDDAGCLAEAGEGVDPSREEEFPARVGLRAMSAAVSRRWRRSSSWRRCDCPGSCASCCNPRTTWSPVRPRPFSRLPCRSTAAPAVTASARSAWPTR